MAYGEGMGYHLHMPSYFWRTFTEYPELNPNRSLDFGLKAISPPYKTYKLKERLFTNGLAYISNIFRRKNASSL